MRSRLIGLSNGDEAGQMTDSLTIPGPYRWPGSVVDNIGGGTFVLTFDERGREVYNGLSGRLVSYNVLELPCYVDVLGETVKYSYLSDGSKCGMMDDALVRGFEYVGPFTYWIDGDDVCLYSVGMSCGRFVKSPDSQGLVPEYWSMDYLGSVRAKSRPGGTEHIDYFPYGQCMKGVASQYDENGYGFNGKELQGFHSVDLYDYGARMYDPGLPLWTTPEPLFEKNHMVHALSFCNGDPVNYVDPDGLDWYCIDETGAIALLKKNDEDFDRLFTYSPYGPYDEAASVKISDKRILQSLAETGRVSTGVNEHDLERVFYFTASKYSFEEWGLYSSGKEFALVTNGEKSNVTSPFDITVKKRERYSCWQQKSDKHLRLLDFKLRP